MTKGFSMQYDKEMSVSVGFQLFFVFYLFPQPHLDLGVVYEGLRVQAGVGKCMRLT